MRVKVKSLDMVSHVYGDNGSWIAKSEEEKKNRVNHGNE